MCTSWLQTVKRSLENQNYRVNAIVCLIYTQRILLTNVCHFACKVLSLVPCNKQVKNNVLFFLSYDLGSPLLSFPPLASKHVTALQREKE
jgi:hypothetical protein